MRLPSLPAMIRVCEGAVQQAHEETALPATAPVRYGATPLVDAILGAREAKVGAEADEQTRAR